MMDRQPSQIVTCALAAGDLCGLLIGKPEYAYLPVRSLAPGDTDLAALLGALYDETNVSERERIRADYEAALMSALESYSGIGPVAYAILFEALRQERSRRPMNIALGAIAERLRDAIQLHREELSLDFSGAGNGWSNGWIGELERLSKLSEELGGPSFA
jgi:hypothetical protein